jgi:hypothetical protein
LTTDIDTQPFVVPQATGLVLLQVANERRRQDERFGEQNRPWNTSQENVPPSVYLLGNGGLKNGDDAKRWVEKMNAANDLGYVEILFEEIAEAFDETDIARVREELVQVAAVAVAAIESIDRNGR